jgi:hypothetical protein
MSTFNNGARNILFLLPKIWRKSDKKIYELFYLKNVWNICEGICEGIIPV